MKCFPLFNLNIVIGGNLVHLLTCTVTNMNKKIVVKVNKVFGELSRQNDGADIRWKHIHIVELSRILKMILKEIPDVTEQANAADSKQTDDFEGEYYIEYVSADVVHLRRCR